MSKFAEKIRKVSRVEAQQLGFVTAQAKREGTMVLIALTKHAKQAAELVQRGADAVVVAEPDAGDAALLKDVIAGAVIGRSDGATEMKERGYDFVVFDPDKTASTAVLEEQIGYVMLLPKDATDVELRSVESFELDAIDIGDIAGTLTVRKQIELRRIFALARKPLIAAVPGDIAANALQALRDTNVTAVTAANEGDLERLRNTIDALPPRARRREDADRAVPSLPHTGPGVDHEHDEEE